MYIFITLLVKAWGNDFRSPHSQASRMESMTSILRRFLSTLPLTTFWGVAVIFLF